MDTASPKQTILSTCRALASGSIVGADGSETLVTVLPRLADD
jgi:hypothetical protein